MDEITSTDSQETSTNSEATPAQETSGSTTEATTQQSTENQPKMVTIEVPEGYEYDGNRQKVPKPFENYAKSFDRYVSKKDQALADAGKKIQEYESKLAEFQKRNNQTEQVTPKQPLFTQEEVDAIALGDAKTLEAVIERKAKQLFDTNMAPTLGEVEKLKQDKVLAQKELEAAESIKSFTAVNPDFTELLESPVGDFMIDAAKRGMSIEDIYKSAKQAESYFTERQDSKKRADFEMKKKGSVVGRGTSSNSDTVYADDENSAKRLAIQLAIKGDKRQVQIKPKK